HDRRPGGSDREPLATLAPAGGEDRTTRTSAHAPAEAMRLGPTTVVRLVRALAHEVLRRVAGIRSPRATRACASPCVKRAAPATRSASVRYADGYRTVKPTDTATTGVSRLSLARPGGPLRDDGQRM